MKMVNVQRANVILTVPEDEVEKYYEKGFNILDQYGNILKASVPSDKGTLQKELVSQKQENEKLLKEIAALKAQNEILLQALSDNGKLASEKTSGDVVEKPKRTYNKRS